MLYRYEAGLGVAVAADRGVAVATDIVVPMRGLQQELIRAGFNVGPTGADGVWGSKTQGALNRALRQTGVPGSAWAYRAEPNRITLTTMAWNSIRALAAGTGGEAPAPARRPGHPRAPAEIPIVSLDEGPDLAPWLLAGGALLMVGGYYYFRKPRRATRRNRRRRPR